MLNTTQTKEFKLYTIVIYLPSKLTNVWEVRTVSSALAIADEASEQSSGN